MPPQSKDFTVAIVGGGMCGLACAVGLIRAGIDVTVFEAAAKFGELGAGIGLGPNGLRALEGLGIREAVLAKVNRSDPDMRAFTYITGIGGHETVLNFTEATKTADTDRGVGVYRPDFLEALLPFIDPKLTHFNKRCISVNDASSGRQLLRFSDGTTFEADLVIGADGIKSAVRKAVIGDDADRSVLHFPNIYGYRALVPIDNLRSSEFKINILTHPFIWVGQGKHLVTYPVKDGTMLNVAAFAPPNDNGMHLRPECPAPWAQVVPQSELLDKYQDWGTDALKILKHVKEPNRWSMHMLHPPLESYYRGNVVLVGDAAHGMLPHLGAGVGQGFEDVCALCELLKLPEICKANLNIALEMYNKLRPPRANMVLEASLKICKTYCSFHPQNLANVRRDLTGAWEPVWHYDLEAALSVAILQQFPSRNSQN